MPNRILREGILTSERVNALSPLAELFYRRLMSAVDDFGRIESNEKILLARCYPLSFDRYSPSNVREWLAECCQMTASGGQMTALVREYEVSGKKYLQIMNFGQRERASKCPPPDFGGQMTASGGVSPPLAARASTPTPPTTMTLCSDSKTDSEFVVSKTDPEFSDWFELQFARHPNKRDRMTSERVTAAAFAAGEFSLALCEGRHVEWCASEGWRWKAGARVPTYGQWITDKGYRYRPPAGAEPEWDWKKAAMGIRQ